MSTVHVLPINDLIEHVDEGDDCPCGPTTEPVEGDDGHPYRSRLDCSCIQFRPVAVDEGPL